MSIGRLALRICTVEALKGRTSVKDNVLDSQIGALDIGADSALRTDQEKPFISVYTELSATSDLSARSLWQNGVTELLIESGITATMTETDPETDESVVIPGIPATDQAFELFLDCLDREVINALTDPDNIWAEIWRGLISGIPKIECKRISDVTTGVRIAAHQQSIICDLLPDPVFAATIAPTSIWKKFIDQMRVEGHPYLPLIEKLLGMGMVELESTAQRRRFGLTLDEARALCDMPPLGLEATEPIISNIVIEKING